MTTTKNEFTFVISAVDRATTSLTSVKRQLESMSAPIDRINRQYDHLRRTTGPLGDSIDDLSGSFENLARFSATRLALPTAVFGAYVLKQASDFEHATNRVKVLAGHAENFGAVAKAEMKSLEDMAREIGKDLRFGPTEVMHGFGELLGSNPDVARAKASIKPVLNLSLAADMQPASAAKLMGAMEASFEKLTATQSANLLARLQSVSSIKLANYDEFLSNVAGQAALRNEDPTAMLAASAVLAKGLIDKSKAGSHMEIFYKKLSNSLTDEGTQKALSDMGFKKSDIFKKVDGVDTLRGIGDLLPKFAKVMNDPKLSKVFGEDAISSILFLLKNLEKFLYYQKDFQQELKKGDANGSAALQAAVSTQGLKGSFEQLKGSVEEFSIALGKSGLLKEATDIVQAATKLTDSLGQLDSKMLSAITNLAAFTIAMSGILAIATPLLRFGAAFGLIPGLAGAAGAAGATAAGAGSTAASAAGLAGLSAGAVSTGAVLGGVAIGGASYLMTQDLARKSGNPLLAEPQQNMSRQEFSNKMLTGAVKQRKQIYEKLISGQDLTPAEMHNAIYYAQSLDARKIEGPQFTPKSFSYGELLRKTKRGSQLDTRDQANLKELQLSRLTGRDVPDLVKPVEIEGGIIVDFKNVPVGTEIRKTGTDLLDLKINFARGPVMPGKGK